MPGLEKGDGSLLCEAPGGPFRQKTPVPFFQTFIRENEVTFVAGEDSVQPDCFFRLLTAGRAVKLAFEIDQSTESLVSHAVSSVRRKLAIYHAYQETVLSQWLAGGKTWERPRFRVVFLTQSVERAYHILAVAAETTRNSTRRLVYAATHEGYLTDDNPLHSPIFLDHRAPRGSRRFK